MQCSSACNDDRDGPFYAVQFRLPTNTNSTKGQPVETFTTQFTRHCRVKPLPIDEEVVGPTSRGIVRYQLKCNRDPETVTVTNKWKAYIPQLDITINLRAQGAIEGRKVTFVGAHVV